jgi:threonine/homoserine/homoserine lactone efflux protein
MLIFAFLKGVAVGFSIAAPVGPIGLLCIRRTLDNGRWAGLLTGLGAATADAIYALLAAFGVTIGASLTKGSSWSHLTAAIVLIVVGIKMATAKPAGKAATPGGTTALWWFVSTFLLTLSNPLTILSFIAVFAALGPAAGGLRSNLMMTLGVFLGSVAWWLILSGGVSAFRVSNNPKHTIWINRFSGGAIAAFGLWALLTMNN